MPASADYSVFAHLNAEKAPLYRAILTHFVTERARFVISLRPAEIHATLINREPPFDCDAEAVATALSQLRSWGNLDDTADSTDAVTIEDFYRNRRLYQLSAAGEAAEHALAVFDEHLHRPGELQTTALQDISDFLDALLPLLAASPPDDAKLHHHLTSLTHRFEQLTARAQTFMRGLQSTVDLQGLGIDDFLAYKEKLIDYLEKFIGELVIATNRISEAVLNLESCGVALAFTAAARREIIDQVDPAPDALARAEAQWRQRWQGLRLWFIAGDSPSQAELLRARARSAIPALLTAVSQINDRRTSRSDRAADFATLARWFAEAPDDAAAHRLWRTAFALVPSRHLRINSETLNARATQADDPRASWLTAAPVWLSPRLRRQGRSAVRGAPTATIDRSADKARILAEARDQTAQIERAREHLLQRGPRRLGDLGPLSDPSFRLFLDLLGHALTQRDDRTGLIDVESADGSLRILLNPIPDAPVATLTTSGGNFTGPDHLITIEATRP